VHISFWTYLKVGLPVTLVTIAISTAWLIVRP
jgi:Na+/H+ antiporter NhaD/arsenite permease-like protein